MTQRTVKRIALGFSWPLGVVWHGYNNPWPGPVPCQTCAATGFNPATKQLFDRFRSWGSKPTKDEVTQLLEIGHTEEEVEQLRERGMPDLSPILKYSLVEVRAKRKGFFGFCPECEGEGFVPNPNPAVAKLYASVNLYDEWAPMEPPEGPGWQLWDDPSEGCPLSPVFATSEELAAWCAKNFRKEKMTAEEWKAWIEQPRAPEEAPPQKSPIRLTSERLRVFESGQPKRLAN
jgi:hypothetical protein